MPHLPPTYLADVPKIKFKSSSKCGMKLFDENKLSMTLPETIMWKKIIQYITFRGWELKVVIKKTTKQVVQ
jgi:hypothetical protein